MKPSNTYVSQEGESWVTSVRELELFKKVIELLLKENLEVHILLMKYDGKPGKCLHIGSSDEMPTYRQFL